MIYEKNLNKLSKRIMEKIQFIRVSRMKAYEGFENENVGNKTNLGKTTFLHVKILNF